MTVLARRTAQLTAVFLFVGVALVGAALAHEEGGEPQTSAQQKCTKGVIGNWAKLSRATGKEVAACVKNHVAGLPLSTNPAVTTLEQCIGLDEKGKLQKQKDTLATFFVDSCGGPGGTRVDSDGFPIRPEYGVTTATTVNAAAQQLEFDSVHDLFGPDLDAGTLVQASAGGDAVDAGKCQQAVLKRAAKCTQELEKQYLKCATTHLKSGGIYGLIYDIDDLALCYDGLDAAKLAKTCNATGQGFQKDIAAKCTTKVDDRTLSELFPVCATNNPITLASCLGARVRCRVCLSANAANGSDRDCDFFDDGDTGNNSCLQCDAAQGFNSTFEGIQALIFDSPTYGCSNNLCHGSVAPQGGLDLTAGNSYANLVGVPGQGASPAMKRVEPGDPATSFLYNKLAAATIPGHPTGGGSPMPTGGAPALTPEHLEAIERWIRGGAPEDLTVDGTALLLGSCLPDPDPLTIPVPDPPGAGLGAQLQQTPWPLLSEDEDEICMSTYYDLTATALIPASAEVPCPPVLLPPSLGGANVNNPSGRCFAYHRQSLYQDPQSHHSIIHLYTGEYGPTDAGWGAWTYKFQDQSNPLEGTSCDPTDVDPATGYNPGCSGHVKSAVACINYGPPDYSQFGGATGNGTAPAFSGSQEPFFQTNYPSGVYGIMPMQGIVAWNSHAFNLTSTDSTMSQYLNLDVAAPADQLYPVQAVFDSASIFVQNVPPFETREYCRTFTLPANAHLFELGSHTHRHGVLFRMWAPPNVPCTPADPACVPRGDTPLYLSTDYTDPLQLVLDPPVAHGSGGSAAAIQARTYLYCSVFDNGAGPGSPAVKRRSTSPEPPNNLPFGGPCNGAETQCIGGPNQGTLCFGHDSTCESSPGAGDGSCDACPLRGGVTTEDEMFIALGNYYIPTP